MKFRGIIGCGARGEYLNGVHSEKALITSFKMPLTCGYRNNVVHIDNEERILYRDYDPWERVYGVRAELYGSCHVVKIYYFFKSFLDSWY